MTADEQDANEVFDAVERGGIGIFRTDVGYAIVGHEKEAIATMYEAKGRSFAKPCGMFGSLDLFDTLIDIGPEAREFVRKVILDFDLPLSIVAPFRPDHPLIERVDPWVLERSSKNGTMDVLMNAGPIHAAIARRALHSQTLVFGSSANRSLSGSKFSFDAIEPEVVAAATVALDRGPTKYSNPDGLGSTIIDLTVFQPVRIGIVFDRIQTIAREECGIEIPAQPINA